MKDDVISYSIKIIFLVKILFFFANFENKTIDHEI